MQAIILAQRCDSGGTSGAPVATFLCASTDRRTTDWVAADSLAQLGYAADVEQFVGLSDEGRQQRLDAFRS